MPVIPNACAAPDTSVETAVPVLVSTVGVPMVVVAAEVSAVPVNRRTGLTMLGVGVVLLAVLLLLLLLLAVLLLLLLLLAVLLLLLLLLIVLAEVLGFPSAAPELVEDKSIDCNSSVDGVPVALA